MEIKEIREVFEVANNYIKKKKLEILEFEKQIEVKKDKMKKIQMALIIIEEHCKQEAISQTGDGNGIQK